MDRGAMATTLTLTAGQLLAAVDAKQAQGDPKQEAYVAFLKDMFLAAKAKGGANPVWNDVVAETRSTRHDLDQELGGRPVGGDWYDWVGNAQHTANALGTVLTVGGLFDPPAAGAGIGLKVGASIVDDMLKLTPVTDLVRNQRADYASDQL